MVVNRRMVPGGLQVGSLDALQTVVEGLLVSGGQLALLPVHVSGLSHSPAALRHTVADVLNLQLHPFSHLLIMSLTRFHSTRSPQSRSHTARLQL